MEQTQTKEPLKIDFEDIRPADITLTLSNGNEYNLRKFNFDDDAWLRKMTGGKKLDELTTEQACRIAFHQMYPESQAQFTPKSVKLINEDTGTEATHQVGGFRLFMLNCSGHMDRIAIIEAILANVGISKPLLDKIIADGNGVDAEALKKKMKKRNQTGRSSSTSSEFNMGGRRKK